MAVKRLRVQHGSAWPAIDVGKRRPAAVSLEDSREQARALLYAHALPIAETLIATATNEDRRAILRGIDVLRTSGAQSSEPRVTVQIGIRAEDVTILGLSPRPSMPGVAGYVPSALPAASAADVTPAIGTLGAGIPRDSTGAEER